MIILGINMSGRDSSAAVVVDGNIHFAIREERLNREKKTRKFPMLAVNACLDAAGTSMARVDRVGISWNPAINLERFNAAQSSLARYKPEHFYGVPNHLFTFFPGEVSTLSEQRFHFPDKKVLEIAYVNHHISHAADAFLQSPFEEAAILVLDAYGEKDSVTFAIGRGTKIEVFRTIKFPYSIGSFYGTITQFLGFTSDMDEWKVMGASPYGNSRRYYKHLRNMFIFSGEGTLEMDLTYFEYPTFTSPTMYSQKLVNLLGPARQPSEELNDRHFDIAAAAQLVTEEIVYHLLKQLHAMTGSSNLCISGGVAMNCVLNGKIPGYTPFKNVHVGSSADDGGTAVGAALYVASQQSGHQRVPVKHNYWGHGFSDDEIETELKKYGIRYRKSSNAALEAAEMIAGRKIIGWFQGRMEFGERALGNRSILADPRDASMRDKVNSAIKYREAFRPFAPAVLEEYCEEYFEGAHPVPFMEKALVIRENKRALIPAVTHVDGTGRLQTVSKDVNPPFWELINEFKKMTGVPVVMNTSFNLQGEPIVCTPKDAIRTFYSSGLDALIMGSYIVEK